MRLLLPLVLAVVTAFTACAPTRQAPADASPSPSATLAATSTASASPTPSTTPAAAAPTATATATPIAVQPSTASPATPVATASPAPATAVPSPVPTAAAAAATPASDVPQRAANAPPEIVQLHIDKTVLRGGDTVSGEVVTSSNVASVEARIANFSVPVPRMSVGHFALAYTVPNLPFFLHGRYALNVIARNSAGAAVSRSVQIQIR